MTLRTSQWAQVKLGDYFDVIRGASPRPKGDPRYFGGNIPWISIRDVNAEPGKFLTKTMEGVTSTGASKSRLLPIGALILSNSGSVCIPKILLVEGCIHDGFVSFPNLENLCEVRYFYYLFEWMRPNVINNNRQGVTQVNLNISIVQNFDIPIPPLVEQKRIADKLDALLMQVDACRNRLDKIPGIIKRFRQAVLAAATAGKLTNKRSTSDKYSILLLDELLLNSKTALRTGPFGTLLAKADHLPSGLDVVGIENIGYGKFIKGSKIKVSKEKAAELASYTLQTGDIIISRSGTVGEICAIPFHIEPMLFSTNIIKISLNCKIILPEYFVFLFLGCQSVLQQVADLCRGSTRIFLNQAILKEIRYPIPSLTEQAEIIREVETLFSFADRLEARYTAARAQVENLTPALLAKAFRGEVVPQDPNDEPASALLARILAQRAAPAQEKKPTGRKTKAAQ